MHIEEDCAKSKYREGSRESISNSANRIHVVIWSEEFWIWRLSEVDEL